MRLRLIVPFFTAILALPAAFRQELDIIPTLRVDANSASVGMTAQRGGATGTYARASEAYRIDTTTGYMSAISSGVLDVGRPVSSTGGTALNGQATLGAIRTGQALTALNRVSDGFTAAIWPDNGVGTPVTRTQNAQTGVSGAVDADTINDTDATNTMRISQNVTVPNTADDYVFTLWVSCGQNDQVFSIAIYNGLTTTTQSYTCTGSGIPAVQSALHKYSVGATNNAGNTTITLFIDPAATSGASTGAITVSRATFYASPGKRVYDFDPLVGAISDYVQAASNVSWSTVTPTETGTLCEWIYTAKPTNGNDVIARWSRPAGEGANSWMEFSVNTSDQLRFVVETSSGALTADISSSTTVSENTWTHACVEWSQSASSIRMFKNGAEVAYNAGDTAWPSGTNFGTTLAVGEDTTNGTSGVNRGQLYFTNLNFWANRLLADSKIMSIYRKQKSQNGY